MASKKSKIHQSVIVIALIFTSVTIPRYVTRLAVGIDLDFIHLSLIALLVAMTFHSALGIPDPSYTFGLIQNTPSTGSSSLSKKNDSIGSDKTQLAKTGPTPPTIDEEKPDPYVKDMEQLVQKLIDLCDLKKEPVGSSDDANALWHSVARQDHKTFSVDVHKRVNADFFFRIIADLDSTPEEVFDFMADIDRRKHWDEICEDGGVVETVSRKTRIQFMRTRGMWPTAARDALVVSFVSRLDGGRLVNVTKSIDSHPSYASISGDVRMTANIAGFIVEPHPSGDPKRCRLYQVMDGDLNGWLPKSIVSLLSTQAFPLSLKKANKALRNISEPRQVSKYIEIADGKGEVPTSDPTATATFSSPADKTLIQRKPASDPSGPASKFKIVLKLLEKYQPVLVALTFLMIILRRRS